MYLFGLQETSGVMAGFKLRRGTHPAVIQQSLLQPDLSRQTTRQTSKHPDKVPQADTEVCHSPGNCSARVRSSAGLHGLERNLLAPESRVSSITAPCSFPERTATKILFNCG